MTDSARLAPARQRMRVVLVIRAALAAVAALVITFTSGHDARLGLLVFGAFAVATGVVLLVGALIAARGVERDAATRASRRSASGDRMLVVAQAIVGLVAGLSALAAAALPSPQIGLFLLLVTGWAAITGLLEFFAGFRVGRPRQATDRDRLVTGILTVLLAIAFLAIPADVRQSFRAPDGGTGVVTAPVVLVGVLGAYLAVIAVYLGIGAFSPQPTAPAPIGAATSDPNPNDPNPIDPNQSPNPSERSSA